MRWIGVGLVAAACSGTVKETGAADPVETGETAAPVATTGPCEGVVPEVTALDPDELAAMLEAKDFTLVNVHIPYQGEIPDTDAHIAYTETDALEDWLGHDVGAKAVLYCRTGPMSATATAALADRGYCRIYDLPAGMVGWDEAGYTLNP